MSKKNIKTAKPAKALKIEQIAAKDLKPAKYNPRKISAEVMKMLEKNIAEFGLVDPLIINKDMTIIGGHQRYHAAQNIGISELPCIVLDLDKRKEKILNLALNKITGEFDFTLLADILQELDAGDMDLELAGFSEKDIEEIMNYAPDDSEEAREEAKKTLAERFIVPPFSIFDARQGYWQDRKRAWLALGIKSEKGRGENLLGFSQTIKDAFNNEASGTSVFDPCLCEIMYRWFMPEAGEVLDPFAGGSVRGIVAGVLGYDYTGIELRAEQVSANKGQVHIVGKGKKPRWIEGDSSNIDKLVSGSYDFVFSCPPYYDLEVYSDLDGELSTKKTYQDFIKVYREIIAKCVAKLKPNSFACFVVGDIRDKKGYYRSFVGDTIAAFVSAGALFYNEAILITSMGSSGLRAAKIFNGGRKLIKTHQNVLVFYKGDPKAIKAKFPAVVVADLERLQDE